MRVFVEAGKLVVTVRHGVGQCAACSATGRVTIASLHGVRWDQRHGHNARKDLIHNSGCPMNDALDKEGNLL